MTNRVSKKCSIASCNQFADQDKSHAYGWCIKYVLQEYMDLSTPIWNLDEKVIMSDCVKDMFVSCFDWLCGNRGEVNELFSVGRQVLRCTAVIQLNSSCQ